MLTHKGTKTICTQRLYLRKYEIKDTKDIYQNYATDELVAQFLTWRPYLQIESLHVFVESQALNDKIDVYNWDIVLKENSQVIGSISVILFNYKETLPRRPT